MDDLNVSTIFTILNPDNTVSFNRYLAHAIGLQETILYQSLVAKYESYRSRNMLDENGYFYSTSSDIYKSTAISRRGQDRIIPNLVKLNLIECKVKGTPPIRHFKINSDLSVLTSFIDSVKNLFYN